MFSSTRKCWPSAFFGSPLAERLTELGVESLIVCGGTTSGCVRATVVDAFSYGFRVLVAEDCCGDADEAPHRSNLADVGRRYADILKTAEVETYLATLPA